MNDDFKKAGSNLSKFHVTYLGALRAVMACDDEKANGLINAVRGLLDKPSAEDAAVQDIKDSLTVPLLCRLYGDHQYKYARVYPYHKDSSSESGPWVADGELVKMIGRHVTALGTDKDAEAFQAFVQKTSKFFGKPYELASAPAQKIA